MREYKISKSVGKRIRIFREKSKRTQEELADEIGVHVSTLGRIERGESNPPIQTINRISLALKVKPKDLF